MQHLGTQTLNTKRLLLRPFTVEDAPAMYRNWACDPEVTRYLTWPPHTDPAGTRAQLEESLYAWGEETGSNTVEVYVHHLRKKFGAGFIRTLRGLGYQLGEPGEAG